MDQLRKFRVEMHSKPSPAYAYYDGHIDVFAEDEDQAIERAFLELRRGAFKDRSRDCWVIDGVRRMA